jgi:hypothetical protein
VLLSDIDAELTAGFRPAARLTSHPKVVRLKSMTLSRLCPEIALGTLS